MTDGPMGLDGFQAPYANPEVNLSQASNNEIILSAMIRTNRMRQSDTDEIVDVLSNAMLEQLKRRVKRALQVRPRDDGQFDVKAEFVCIRMDEWKRMFGEQSPTPERGSSSPLERPPHRPTL